MFYTRVLLLIVFFTKTVTAQERLELTPEIDNKIIDEKLQDLRSKLTEDDNTRYDFGEITYSPDMRFKILTIHAEACGAYCHTFFYSNVYYKKNGVTIKSNMEMADLSIITDIIKIKTTDSASEYLIFDKRHVRPRSAETGTEISFSHLVFKKDTPAFKKIHIYAKEGALFKYYNMHFYSSENMCLSGDEEEEDIKGIPPTLSYEAKNMTITYEYAKLDDQFSYPCKYITGTYKYKNGIFTNK